MVLQSSVWGRRSLHCDDSCGGCGPGLTRRFTGLVPLPWSVDPGCGHRPGKHQPSDRDL